MAKTTKPKTTKPTTTTTAEPKFKRLDFAIVKGQSKPCQIIEVDEKAKAYKLYVMNETFTQELSEWIKEKDLKTAPKEA